MGPVHSYTPNGHLVELCVGNNNALRLPHALREGAKDKELPEARHCYSVRTLTNTTDEASSEFFLRLFNHAQCHTDKVHRTLGPLDTIASSQTSHYHVSTAKHVQLQIPANGPSAYHIPRHYRTI